MKRTLPRVDSKFGAPQGRRTVIPCGVERSSPKLQMKRLKWVGEYDQGGAYWGRTWVPDYSVKTTRGTYMASVDVYWAYNEKLGIDIFVYATSRSAAKEQVRMKVPGARFFN